MEGKNIYFQQDGSSTSSHVCHNVERQVISIAHFEIWDMHLARLCKRITHVISTRECGHSVRVGGSIHCSHFTS